MIVIALAVIAGALALALAATGAALPFITVGGFLTTGGALVLTAAWLYSEGRALDRRALAHARARRR